VVKLEIFFKWGNIFSLTRKKKIDAFLYGTMWKDKKEGPMGEVRIHVKGLGGGIIYACVWS
jgi:hypothetical protein